MKFVYVCIQIVQNLSKITTVSFTLDRPKDYNTILINDQNNVAWSHNIKQFTWNSHISTKLQQGYQRLKIIYPLINHQT